MGWAPSGSRHHAAGAGSPEATPSVNGSASKWLPVRAHPSGAAATPSAPRKNVRRLVFIA